MYTKNFFDSRRRGLASVLAVAGLVPAWLGALYMTVETRQVPVERLLANLEAARAADPGNPRREVNIARLYGMAYALRAEQVPATSGLNDKDEPWYGYTPNSVPYTARPLTQSERGGPAEVYLKKSLQHYEAALKLKTDDPLARLGLGWTLQQDGNTAGAIREYRRVIDLTWPDEQKAARATFQPYFTAEAADYLMPLLDPVRDSEEITELQARRDRLRRLPRPITPIAIPLEDEVDATTTIDWTARVRFDADGSGERRTWTWISPRAGWLVFDADGAGRVSSALQWFGTVTFWLFWNDGYEALSALDDNGDGELTGTELRSLAIWRDANQNGVSERGEVLPLSAYDVTALSCRSAAGDGVTLAAISPRGVRFGDGRVRPTYDVILHSSDAARRLTLGVAPLSSRPPASGPAHHLRLRM